MNRCVRARMLFLPLIVLAAAGGAALSTPLAFWQAEGDFADSAGRNGLVSAGAVGFRPGAVGQGFDMPGNAHLEAPSLHGGAGISAQAFTIALWLRQDAFTSGASLVNLRRPQNNSGFSLEFDIPNGLALHWFVHNHAPVGVNGYQLVSVPNCAVNRMHHLAVSFDSVAGRINIFRNGKLIKSEAAQTAFPNTRVGDEVLMIGRNAVVAGHAVDGMLDDIRIFNQALSESQVAALLPPGIACITDLNCSGTTEGFDLGVLLAGWSNPPGSPGCAGSIVCPADLNSDGTVNGVDLGIMLNSFGQSCN